MDAGDSRQGLVFLMECGHGVPRIQLRKAIIFGFLRVGFSLCIPLHNELALGRYHCVAL
jgi:hypothetical protein